MAQGHTVFIVSWRNPDESDAMIGIDDYLELGILDSLAAVARLVPDAHVHACGYCLGGTLLSAAVHSRSNRWTSRHCTPRSASRHWSWIF